MAALHLIHTNRLPDLLVLQAVCLSPSRGYRRILDFVQSDRGYPPGTFGTRIGVTTERTARSAFMQVHVTIPTVSHTDHISKSISQRAKRMLRVRSHDAQL